MFSSLGHRNISELQPALLVNCRGKRKRRSFAWEISHSVTAAFHFPFAVMLKQFKMVLKKNVNTIAVYQAVMKTDVTFRALQYGSIFLSPRSSRGSVSCCLAKAARVGKTTHRCVALAALVQVTTIKTVKQMEDLVDLGDGAAWYEKWRIKLTTLFHQVSARQQTHKLPFLYCFFFSHFNLKSVKNETAPKQERRGLSLPALGLFVCLLVIVYWWDIPVSPPVPGLVVQPWEGSWDVDGGRKHWQVCCCASAVSDCTRVCLRRRCGETSRRFSRRNTAAPPT